MGTYINPGKAGCRKIAGPDYVDKTMLIALMNDKQESRLCEQTAPVR